MASRTTGNCEVLKLGLNRYKGLPAELYILNGKKLHTCQGVTDSNNQVFEQCKQCKIYEDNVAADPQVKWSGGAYVKNTRE